MLTPMSSYKKTIKNIGLDVHKNSISIGIADDDRDGEVRYYCKIDNDIKQLDRVIRKLISKALVEAAHAYRFAARKSRAILKRQEELPKGVVDTSWKA